MLCGDGADQAILASAGFAESHNSSQVLGSP